MGWTTLLDKNNNNIGAVSDEAWDLAGEFLDELNEIYKRTWNRNTTKEEVKQIISFCWNPEIESEEKFKTYEFIVEKIDILRGYRIVKSYEIIAKNIHKAIKKYKKEFYNNFTLLEIRHK